jgi:hypothetical protein
MLCGLMTNPSSSKIRIGVEISGSLLCICATLVARIVNISLSFQCLLMFNVVNRTIELILCVTVFAGHPCIAAPCRLHYSYRVPYVSGVMQLFILSLYSKPGPPRGLLLLSLVDSLVPGLQHLPLLSLH